MLRAAPDGSPLRLALRAHLRDDPSSRLIPHSRIVNALPGSRPRRPRRQGPMWSGFMSGRGSSRGGSALPRSSVRAGFGGGARPGALILNLRHRSSSSSVGLGSSGAPGIGLMESDYSWPGRSRARASTVLLLALSDTRWSSRSSAPGRRRSSAFAVPSGAVAVPTRPGLGRGSGHVAGRAWPRWCSQGLARGFAEQLVRGPVAPRHVTRGRARRERSNFRAHVLGRGMAAVRAWVGGGPPTAGRFLTARRVTAASPRRWAARRSVPRAAGPPRRSRPEQTPRAGRSRFRAR